MSVEIINKFNNKFKLYTNTYANNNSISGSCIVESCCSVDINNNSFNSNILGSGLYAINTYNLNLKDNDFTNIVNFINDFEGLKSKEYLEPKKTENSFKVTKFDSS